MGAVLQWRKFNFFDVNVGIDKDCITQSLKNEEICSTCSGRGLIHIGDSRGFIHSLNRQLHLSTFKAYSSPVTLLEALDTFSLLIAVGTSSDGTCSEVKIIAPDRCDSQGIPQVLRTLKPDPRVQHGREHQSRKVPKVTALTIHPSGSLMALGFKDGSVMLYRGEIRRERGSKIRHVLTLSSGAITNMHLRQTNRRMHLFVTTIGGIYALDVTTKEKETTVVLDNLGCQAGCSVISDSKHERELLVARDDAIYSYTVDSRGSCYVFDGPKVSLSWFNGSLVVATRDMERGSSSVSVSVFDPLNKLVSLSCRVDGLKGVHGEWGGLYMISIPHVGGVSLDHMMEKDLQTKLEILFRKNQFDIAISLARMQRCDPEEVAEILCQYGDWLYGKGNQQAAMDQYIKTIPHLEPSYVIKKYLDPQHIPHLTTYLQALHLSGNASTDHTTLMLNCYTRLKDSTQLDLFIKQGEIECDITLGIRVCRGAGFSSQALELAKQHGLHQIYVDILVEDKKDFKEALRFISSLGINSAHELLLGFGSTLLSHSPDETTNLLIRICTDWRDPPSHNGASENVDPSLLDHLLVGHSECLVIFLEGVLNRRSLSSHLGTTLLAERLHHFSMSPEGQERSLAGEKILQMLRNSEIDFDRDNALLLCDKHQFHSGKMLLWEQAGMFASLLEFYWQQGEFKNIIGVCQRHSNEEPSLWVLALRLLMQKAPMGNNPAEEIINTILNKIEKNDLISSLEIVDLLTSSPHLTLGSIRSFLVRLVESQTKSLEAEMTTLYLKRADTCKMKEQVGALTDRAVEFTATRCDVCKQGLDLPSVHFLCMHSFHSHCFESYSETESECPLCLPENDKIRKTMKAQENSLRRHEVLQGQLERTSDCFSVVADFVSRGAFGSGPGREQIKRIHKTKGFELPSSAFVPTDSKIASVASEGRLRLEESRGSFHHSQISIDKGTKKINSSSFPQQKFQESPNLPLQAYIMPSSLQKSRPDLPTLHAKSSPINPFDSPIKSIVDSNNPFSRSPSLTKESNPFDEDCTNNPFGEDESVQCQNPFEDESEKPKTDNPFEDDYDNNLNPFI